MNDIHKFIYMNHDILSWYRIGGLVTGLVYSHFAVCIVSSLSRSLKYTIQDFPLCSIASSHFTGLNSNCLCA